MPEVARFFDAISYGEADQAEVQARFRSTGVLIEIGNRLTMTAPGGMFVGVADGEAMVEGFHYKNTALLNLPIAGNSSGSTRIDRIVLRLNRTGNSLVAAILQGVPGAGAPTLTQVSGGTYELLLGQVTVASGAITITPMLVADNRTYSGSSVGSSLSNAPIAPLGYVAPRENRFDNPSLRVNQRSVASITVQGFVADRWPMGTGGNVFGMTSQLLDVAPPNMSFVVGETARCIYTNKGNNTAPAAGDFWSIQQVLEGTKALPLYGLPMCTSWWSYSNKVGTYGFTLDQTNTTYKYFASWTHGLANGWQFNYVVVPFNGGGAPTANWLGTSAGAITARWVLGSGSNYIHTATNLWTNGLTSKYAGPDFNSGLTATGDSMWIYQPKIESGLYPTRFEAPDFSVELLACMRHYQTSYQYGIVVPSNTGATFHPIGSNSIPTSQYVAIQPFIIPMRTVPTVTVYPYANVANTSRVSNDTGVDFGANSGVPAAVYTTHFGIVNTSGVTLTTNQFGVHYGWQATAEL